MNITRNNYEEFFMLYADNELPAAARKEVETFVEAHPDLQQELALVQQFKLSPDETILYTGKEALLKQENGEEFITVFNYPSLFVLYADDELSNDQRAAVETFVYQHPQLQAGFELLQQVKLIPDANITFKNKENLYRKEEDDKVVPFRWWKPAVAAMLLLMAGLTWLAVAKRSSHVEIVKNTVPVANPPLPSLYKIEEKKGGDTHTATDITEQPLKDTIAVNFPARDNQHPGNMSPVNTLRKAVKKKDRLINNNDLPQTPDHAANDDVAVVTDSPLKRTTVTSISKSENKAVINTVMAAAADKSVINQQLVYHSTAAENITRAAAPEGATAADKLEVLNTSVDTKNSLRGFFRKASRLIAKKTSLADEDSKNKSILIGGFEIAVR